ncbi:MAG: arsenic efflux protein [Alphaproteobacteria bacterium]|nr:arsenic efflux protein [Alphaproteobacteria bacterium]
MTAIAQQLKQVQVSVILMMTLAVLVMSMGAASGLTDVVLSAIADAYIQVSSFVAATLFLFYGAEKFAKLDLEKMLANADRGQIVYAALLGALPGCGGAIIVITQYVTGRLSFGAVTAVLTATMGDAAFLLIAQEPVTGMAMLVMGFSVGVVSGYIVDAIHGKDFLRQPMRDVANPSVEGHGDAGLWLNRFWMVLIIPGFALGVMAALQIDSDALHGTRFLPAPSLTIGAAGGVLSVFMFIVPKFLSRHAPDDTEIPMPHSGIAARVISDTNFVTAWVVAAFLLFEVSVYSFGIDLHGAFRGYAIFTPLIATLFGFIPGCGPQVLVTTLYLAGAIPLSAQISNAISNDGDALFPAIAIAPKVAIVATLYSAIPALLLGYGWMVFVEGI